MKLNKIWILNLKVWNFINFIQKVIIVSLKFFHTFYEYFIPNYF